MALPLTETDKFLLLSAVGAPETRDRISALLDLAGTGNMTGPASATDNALVRYDGTTGALVQNSGVIVSDANALSGITSISATSVSLTGNSTLGDSNSDLQTLNGSVVINGDGNTLTLTKSNNLPTVKFTSSVGNDFYIENNLGTLRFLNNGSTDRLSLSQTGTLTVNQGIDLGTQIRTGNGTVGSPAYSFTSDTNTGMWLGAADELELSTGGSARFRIANAATVNFVPFYAFDGSASAPGITFNADTDTGIYRGGANSINFAIGGTSTAGIDAGGINTIRSNVGTQLLIYTANTDNTNAASHAVLAALAGGPSGGDPFLRLDITGGGANWTMGVDNSDSDTLKIQPSGSVGTSTSFSISTAGLLTLGTSGGTQTHVVNGYLSMDAGSTNPTLIRNVQSNANMIISGGNDSGSGSRFYLYGATHATKANVYEWINDTGTVGSVSSAGLWTLGTSGGAQNHVANGLSFAITTASTSGSKLAAISTDTGGKNWIWQSTGSGDVNGAGNFQAVNVTNGITTLRLGTAGAVTIGASGGTQLHAVNGGLSVTSETTGLARIRGNAAAVTVAAPDPSTNTLSFGANAAAEFLVVNGATGAAAKFMIWGGGTDIEKIGGAAVYTITSGTAASINITNSAGTITIQNKTGSALDLRFIALAPN